MNQLLKLILTGILILCFLKMPSLFYRFSGYVLFSGFGWLAYDAFQRRDQIDVKIFVILAILYNPFITFPFPNFLWIIINVLVIIGLILNMLFAEDNPYEDQIKKDDR
jgi:fatty acid desaturase